MKKQVIKITCYLCKFDRFFSEKTARQINRSMWPYVCDKCLRKNREAYKESIKDAPKWEGVTIDCSGIDLKQHVEKSMKKLVI